MSRSFIALALSVLALAFAPRASAQAVDPAQPPACDHHGEHGERAERVAHMIHQLGLDAHQADAVRQIALDARTERTRIQAMPRGSAERVAAHQALEQQTHARIDAVLTAPQRAHLAQMRAHRGGHGHGHGHRGGHGRAAPPPAI